MTTFGDFDISQDGSQVVLERVQERSDVMLWIPYHNLASTQPSDRRARSIRESLQPGGWRATRKLCFLSRNRFCSSHRQRASHPDHENSRGQSGGTKNSLSFLSIP